MIYQRSFSGEVFLTSSKRNLVDKFVCLRKGSSRYVVPMGKKYKNRPPIGIAFRQAGREVWVITLGNAKVHFEFEGQR